MTVPADTFDSYEAKGNREHLVDMIYDVSPTETPFMSAISRVKTTSTKHEWQTDALTAAATNYNVEGDDATTDASAATARLYNYTQILDKVAIVSGTQEAVSKAGRASEMAYQMARRAKELKRDVELALLDNNAAVAGNGTNTAREMAGVPAWIITNVDKNGSTDPTGDGTNARSGGTDIAITEARLKNAIQKAWTSGGNPDTILCTAFNKQAISSFSGNGTRLIAADSNKLNAAYEIYVSDFGSHKVVPSRYMETDQVLVLDTSLWKMAVLRDFQVKDLAINGDVIRKQLLIEATLEACNEKGNAIVADVTNS